MKTKIRLGVAASLALLVAAACAGPSGPDTAATQGTPLPDGKVSVLEFTQDGAQVSYGESTDAFGLTVASEIASALRKRGHDAEAVPRGGAPDGDVLVKGRILRIDGGNRATRYLVGFGAGAAKLGVEGEVERADGASLGSFSHERWAGMGVFGGATAALMAKCQRAVSHDVAEMIATGQYTRVE